MTVFAHIRRFFTTFFLVTGLLVFTGSANAQTINVTTLPIPGLVVSAVEGPFVELYQEAAERAGVSADLQVLPAKRARHYFESGKVDSFFPALDASLKVDAAKAVFHVKKIYAFVREGDDIPSDVEQLEGKKVCLTRGFTYPRELALNEDIKVGMAENPVHSFKKLAAGRCDYFVADPKVGASALEESGVDGVIWDPEVPLAAMDVYFAFHTDEVGKDLAARFTAALKSMKDDGTFAAIMAKAK